MACSMTCLGQLTNRCPGCSSTDGQFLRTRDGTGSLTSGRPLGPPSQAVKGEPAMQSSQRHANDDDGALTARDFRGTSEGGERRREPRVLCDREIAVMPCRGADGRGFRRVGLADCSPHGLGLVSPEPMVPGEEFLAELKLKLQALVLLVYRVQHCSPAGGGHFRIGAELVGTITPPNERDADAALKAILDQAD